MPVVVVVVVLAVIVIVGMRGPIDMRVRMTSIVIDRFRPSHNGPAAIALRFQAIDEPHDCGEHPKTAA